MMVKSLLLAALVALAAASPAQSLGRDLGGRCAGPHGEGTWQHADDCKGISLPEKTCPKDQSGVQCCVEIQCNADGGEGMCRSVKKNGCSKGEFHPDACPGNDDIQCCIQDCEDEPEPEPASTTCTEEQQSSSYPASASQSYPASASQSYPASASQSYPASASQTYPASASATYPASDTAPATETYPTKSHGHHSHTKSEKPTYSTSQPKESHTKYTSHTKSSESKTYTSKPKHSDTSKPTGKPTEKTSTAKPKTTEKRTTTSKPKPKPTSTSKPKPKPSSSSVGKKVLAQAMKAKGTPYAWRGGSCKGPSHDTPPYQYGDVGFDCSGLVCWAVCQVTGRDLFKAGLRNTHSMYCASEHTLGYKKYKYADRQVGDAVFFGDECSCSNSKSIHHVGLIMDDKDNMFNSPNDRVNKAQVNSIPKFGEKPCPYVIRFAGKK